MALLLVSCYLFAFVGHNCYFLLADLVGQDFALAGHELTKCPGTGWVQCVKLVEPVKTIFAVTVVIVKIIMVIEIM